MALFKQNSQTTFHPEIGLFLLFYLIKNSAEIVKLIDKSYIEKKPLTKPSKVLENTISKSLDKSIYSWLIAKRLFLPYQNQHLGLKINFKYFTQIFGCFNLVEFRQNKSQNDPFLGQTFG